MRLKRRFRTLYAGVAGLYVAGAFSGTLSTVSSGVNSIATCFITDFVKLSEGVWIEPKSDNFYKILRKVIDAKFNCIQLLLKLPKYK